MRTRLAVGLLLALVATAHAQPASMPPPAPPSEKPAAKPLPRFSVTFSPIHLVLPVFEVTTEVRLAPTASAALILGAGQVTPEGATESATVTELGFQGRYYPIGKRKHRMQVGAEVMFVHGEGESGGAAVTADGVAIGPFVGYKFTAEIGFTFDAQLGFQRIGIGAESETTTASEKDWIALLNLNVGWSF
jgi:hypothetical protein